MTQAAREPRHAPAASPAAPAEDASRRAMQNPLPPTVRVRTDRAAVAAFQAAAGQSLEDNVPLTFPFCWLALPVFRPAIAELVGGDGFLPIHESQSFDYAGLLDLDADYLLEVAATRAENPSRLRLNAVVSTLQGAVRLRFETVLRIVPSVRPPAQ